MANRKFKEEGLPYNHIHTGIKIYQSITCSNCPYRLYHNEKDTVTMGIGNINSNFIFVLPTYDTRAKVGSETTLTLLIKAYNEITGKDIFEEIYITRLVKCYKNVDHNLYKLSITPCSNYLVYEFNRLMGKNVVFFGSTYEDYINNSDTVGLNIPLKNIYKIYSPDVLFYDNPLIKDKFITNLTSIININ